MDNATPGTDHAGATVPPARTDDVDGLTAADVMHGDIDGLPASMTVGELREWFALSRSRRLAVLAADRRYVAAFTPADVPDDAAAELPAIEFAGDHPTVSPQTTARAARDLVVASGARRLPVVDDAGVLLGVVAVTTDLQFFACRPQPAPD
jgi:CBS-domain-containing membrane protein